MPSFFFTEAKIIPQYLHNITCYIALLLNTHQWGAPIFPMKIAASGEFLGSVAPLAARDMVFPLELGRVWGLHVVTTLQPQIHPRNLPRDLIVLFSVSVL